MSERHIEHLGDLTPDERNANKGTERGLGMLEDSLRKYGAGRSILVDKNGKIIAGNKTVEVAGSIGLDDVIVVHSDGTKLIAVQRDDLDLDTDPAARKLAVMDNRTGEVGLEWDAEALAALVAEDAKALEGMFTGDELAALMAGMPSGHEWANSMGELPDGDKPGFQQMTFTLSNGQAKVVQSAIGRARALGPFVDTGNENGNGNALARICETYDGSR